ncbi:hypothetical protein SAMN05216559_0858 [Halomicrobium zhouii]|uniref:Uncharacterized protein n=1 Tax=Halomicrobium zhouii TaxID=767519 RepID=A0A1I6KIB7_9EURY|nr:hypothetical protein [Halomicrobium zhouii]SFR90951.1 hypothetical protein SAMN05216559_0858 [Halomicrobium zhouii]
MRRRGQLVLVAAVIIAVAMIPMVLAYLQLGYHADVRASGAHDDPSTEARSVLVRSVHSASVDVPGTFRWSSRDAAVNAVRSDLDPRLSTVETARVDEGIHRNVTYNQTLASRWSSANCPTGPDRQFGSCEAIDGVVVQERAGWTHVLAVAFDLVTDTRRQHTELSTVVRAGYE